MSAATDKGPEGCENFCKSHKREDGTEAAIKSIRVVSDSRVTRITRLKSTGSKMRITAVGTGATVKTRMKTRTRVVTTALEIAAAARHR